MLGGPFACSDLADLEKQLLHKRVRRIGRFIRMATVGAVGCLNNIGLSVIPERLGVFLGSGLANHGEEKDVVRAVLSEAMPSPTRFANSVSNSVTFFIARALDARGQNMLVSQEEFSFESALMLADMALSMGEMDYALVGGADDLGISAPETLVRRLNMPADMPLGEGCGWLLLGRDPRHEALGHVVLAEQIRNLGQVPEKEPPGSDGLALIQEKILHARRPGEDVWLLPGFRVGDKEIGALREGIAGAKVAPYLDRTGVFFTAFACDVAARMKACETPGLLVHLARNAYGEAALVILRS
jgi:hypothetical protein